LITVLWDDAQVTLEKNSSLLIALQKQAYHEHHFAIMLNQNFIPRPLYESTFLNDGDIIKIIRPMQGG
jgi:thiamine biosynthesis protein ThiS